MVKYCNATCKKKHRHKHKKDCEEHLKRAAERAAELHDEKLFKQPPPMDDCPICMIRLPTESAGQTYKACCGKLICIGCAYAPVFDHKGNIDADGKCPFCRTPAHDSDEEIIQRLEKRMELNDAQAISSLGCYYSKGEHGLPQSNTKALELWHRAGELGCPLAYSNTIDTLGNVIYISLFT